MWGKSLRSVDLHAGEGRGVAATARLKDFELMEILEKQTVKVSLVPLGVFDGASGENAIEARCGAVEALDEGPVLAEIPVGRLEGVALETDQTIESPEGQGEDKLEIALGLEGGDLAGEMIIPVGLLLDFRDDGIGGEDAMASAAGEERVLGGRPRGRRAGRGAGSGRSWSSEEYRGCESEVKEGDDIGRLRERRGSKADS